MMAAEADHRDGQEITATVWFDIIIVRLRERVFTWRGRTEAELHVDLVGIFRVDPLQQFALVLSNEFEVLLVCVSYDFEGLDGRRGAEPAVQLHARPEPKPSLDLKGNVHLGGID